MRYTRLLSWAQGFYVAGLALGLLFIIPSAWFPLQLGKASIAAVCMLIAAVLFVLSGGIRHLLRDRNPHVVLIAALIPIVYLLSFFFSIDQSVGVTGFAAESDTLIFITLAFSVFVLGLGLFRSMWSARLLLLGVTGIAAIAGVFQYIVVMFGTSMLPAIFSDRSVNLVGKWNDLGLLIGLLLLLTIIWLEYGAKTTGRQIGAYAVAALSVLLLAIINFPLVWMLLLGFCIALGLWSFIGKRSADAAGGYISAIPWLPVVGALLSFVLLLWGTVVNTGLTGIFPVSSLEVRPSFSSSLGVVKDAHGSSFERFLLGTGPQTFGDEWVMHKPASVNQSLFWSLDFNVGFSSFITSLGTVGLLGVLAWLAPLLLVLLALVYALRSVHFTAREKLYAMYLGLGGIYLWSGILFYVPSEILMLMAFAVSGATLGFVLSKRDVVEHVHTRTTYSLSWVAVVILVVLVGWSTVGMGRRLVAEASTNQGLLALQNGNADDAIALANKSQGVEKNGDNLRLGVDAGLAKLQQIAAAATTPTQQQLQDFAVQAQKTIPLGQAAIAMNPQDYRAYLSLGRVYDFLASLKVAGGYENAKAAYQAAAIRNPTNPQIPLLLARLEAQQGNLAGVQSDLSQALTMKPDYTDAILFVVQLNVAQKDIPNAIRAATAAVQSAPGVPSIWFELGLLYYSAGDTKDAIPPLEQAVKLQSDYANAKYFLGLSYAAQNRVPDAIAQFNDLEKTNADNQEVKLILSNLQSGKAPFANAQPPVTTTPQDRTTAPISQ